MSKKNDGSNVIAVFIVIGFLLLIGLGMDASTPKCMKAKCKNDQSPNSSYCYLHKPYTGHSSYKSKSSSSSTSTYGNKRNSSSSTKSYGTSKMSSYYSSYDDGYDAIYDDDDYDDDRYWSDSDYADGVDDAMDELDW